MSSLFDLTIFTNELEVPHPWFFKGGVLRSNVEVFFSFLPFEL